MVSHSLRGEGFDASEDGTGRGTPLVPTYTLAIRGRGDSHDLEYRTDGTANALLTPNGGRGGIGVGAIAFSAQDNGRDAQELIAPTMRKGGDGGGGGGVQFAVAFMETMSASTPDVERSQTLQAKNKGAVMTAMQVRRLTPMECERLQGFSDNYTLIPHRGKPAADGPRYKALGNSWAVPCARWIGERIAAVEAIHAEQRKAA